MSTSLEYFQMEAVERLERLSSGLMTLERSGDDQTLITDLFREAHSLKGAAGVSGLTDISEICHKMEDLLSTVRDGSRQASEPMIDALLSATDDVQKLVAAQAQQRDCDIDPAAVIQRLSNLDRADDVRWPAEAVDASDPEGSIESSLIEPNTEQKPEVSASFAPGGRAILPVTDCAAGKSAHPTAAVPAPALRASDQSNQTNSCETGYSATDTVRLRVDMLESLGNLTGELMVAGDRFRQRLDAVRQLHSLVSRQRSRHADDPRIHELLRPIADELHHLTDSFSSDVTVIDPLIAGIHEQVLDTRMLPLSVLFDSLPRFVRDYCRAEDKQAELYIEGADTRVDRQVLEQLRDPVIHLIRNSVSHGIESPADRQQLGKEPAGSVRLTTSRHGDRIRITCQDDGRGIDRSRVLAKAIAAGLVNEAEASELSNEQIDKLILEPGLSTAEMITDVSGRGVGMDVVVSRLEALRGTLAVESEVDQFTRFVLEFPASMATLEGLLVQAAGYTYIVPTMSVERTARIKVSELHTSAGGELVIQLDGQAVPVAMLASLLGREGSEQGGRGRAERAPGKSTIRGVAALHHSHPDAGDRRRAVSLSVVVVRYRDRLIAIGVDRLLGTQTVVAKGLGNQIGTVRGVAGATILGSGLPALILDLGRLVQDGGAALRPRDAIGAAAEVEVESARLLIVDDSLTTRMMEKSILESAGYNVDLAVSAEDALEQIEASAYRLIVCDVEMPGMNGFELTRKLRTDDRFAETPIIIVSSLGSEQHRREGLESGANAYIVKGEFDQNNLLETVERLVGT